MAHNPSDATVRLMHVAVSGVSTLLSLAVAAVGAIYHFADKNNIYATGVFIVGVAAAAACGLRTAFLVFEWRKHRGERGPRP